MKRFHNAYIFLKYYEGDQIQEGGIGGTFSAGVRDEKYVGEGGG
jgi:hypothetical protein